MQCTLEVDFFETEDQEKLVSTVRSIFPDAELKKAKGKLIGKASVENFWKLVDQEGIRNTIQQHLEEQGFVDLSKMAAVAGKISVDQGFPLGKIWAYSPRR